MGDVTMGNQQPCDADLGWLAGIIDGEGYLGITLTNQKRWRSVKAEIQIVNTDPYLLDKVVEILRKIGVSPYIRTRTYKTSSWNTAWNITIGKLSAVEKVLVNVLPYLTGIKWARAKLMLEFVQQRMPKGRRPYDPEDLDLIEEFNALRGSTTIPEGSRIQEDPKRRAHLKYIKV